MSTVTKKKPTVDVDVIVIFANLTRPDNFQKYSVQFAPKNEAELAKLSHLGVTAKTKLSDSLAKEVAKLKLDPSNIFSTTRKLEFGPVNVVDTQGNVTTEIVGNGSTVRLRMTVSRTLSKTTGEIVTTLYMTDAQVLNLVPYVKAPKAPAFGKTTDGTFVSTGIVDTEEESPLPAEDRLNVLK